MREILGELHDSMLLSVDWSLRNEMILKFCNRHNARDYVLTLSNVSGMWSCGLVLPLSFSHCILAVEATSIDAVEAELEKSEFDNLITARNFLGAESGWMILVIGHYANAIAIFGPQELHYSLSG